MKRTSSLLSVTLIGLLALTGCDSFKDEPAKPAEVNIDAPTSNYEEGSKSLTIGQAEQLLDAALSVKSTDDNDVITKYNSLAVPASVALRKAAKSTASLEFIELTAKQNKIVAEMTELNLSGEQDIIFFEEFDYATATQNQLRLLEESLKRICSNVETHGRKLSTIIDILREKIALSGDPLVIEELLSGNTHATNVLEKIYLTQKSNLADNDMALENLDCEVRLNI